MTTGWTFWDKLISYYGLPYCFISDQDNKFESDLITELCKTANVQRLCTSLYHPETNGLCKHFTCTIISMLGTLPEKKKAAWHDMASDMNTNTSTKFVKKKIKEKTLRGLQNAKQVFDRKNQCYKCNYDHKMKCTCLQKGVLFLIKQTT